MLVDGEKRASSRWILSAISFFALWMTLMCKIKYSNEIKIFKLVRGITLDYRAIRLKVKNLRRPTAAILHLCK